MAVSLPQSSPARRRVTILGSTGSVGCRTVDLLRRNAQRFEIEALTANRNVALLAEQAKLLRPRLAVIADAKLGAVLKEALAGTGIESSAGAEAVAEAAARPAESSRASEPMAAAKTARHKTAKATEKKR